MASSLIGSYQTGGSTPIVVGSFGQDDDDFNIEFSGATITDSTTFGQPVGELAPGALSGSATLTFTDVHIGTGLPTVQPETLTFELLDLNIGTLTVTATDEDGNSIPLTITANNTMPEQQLQVSGNQVSLVSGTNGNLPGGDGNSITITAPPGVGIRNLNLSVAGLSPGNGGEFYYKLVGISPSTPSMICFTSDTMIETDRGEVAIEELNAGDMLRTFSNGFRPIVWIGKRILSGRHLKSYPKHRPIRIRAGSLGANIPSRDLCVSPQHRILVRSAIAKRMFDKDEVLIPAVKLLGVDGIEIASDVEDSGVTYWHILLESHEVIHSNGALSESLYVGPQALRAISPEGRREIAEVLPEVFELSYQQMSSFRFAEGKRACSLVARHTKNRKSLVEKRFG